MKAVLGFVAIWLVAGVIIFLARSSRATPESVAQFIQENPVDGKGEAGLTAFVTELAAKVNSMPFEQRHAVQVSDSLSQTFRALPPAQQRTYIELTLPNDMRETMEALNKMPPAERQAFVDAALKDAGRDLGFENDTVNPENVRKVVEDGLGAFYNHTSPEVKLQMAPVLERLQARLRSL